MKAIVFDRIGSPEDVLYLAEVAAPEITDDEVLVRMVSSSINPGDFLFIQNLYPEPKKPHFPRQIAGGHGAGVVEKAGANVAVKPGTFVAFSYYNTWAEYAAVPAEWLIPLPDNYPIERAGQLMNPITAWDLLADCRVQPGQWLALTAGYSAISTMVLQFATRRGINVISFVRKTRPHIDLAMLGATAVIDLSGPTVNVKERLAAITSNAGIQGFIDNVGGPVTGELIRCLSVGGQAIINGGISAARFELHNLDILLKGVEVRPNVYRYFFSPPRESEQPELHKIIEVFGETDFHVLSGGLHPLTDFELAISSAWNQPHLGKQSFKM